MIQSRHHYKSTTAIATGAMLLSATPAWAHISQQGFVQILPTGIYTTAGVATVIVTILILVAMPRVSASLFNSYAVFQLPSPSKTIRQWTSIAMSIALFALVISGLYGPRNPLTNPLTLSIWTVWWVALIPLAALFGNFWRWINPWWGLCRLVDPRWRRLFLPGWLGVWPAIILFGLFTGFALADPAPDAPPRLARLVALYWTITFIACIAFGPSRWLRRGEFISVLMKLYAQLAVFAARRNRMQLGLTGWRLTGMKNRIASLAVFALVLLGAGSFDGLNETFTWLSLIGVNPLAFPGRSAIIIPTLVGLFVCCVALVFVFYMCTLIGRALSDHFSQAGNRPTTGALFSRLALSIIPIALGYHIAHYLPVFLVNGQYVLVALSDPFSTGADFLGLGEYYVSTGFFKDRDSVRLIWLTQAGFVVGGHVISVLVAHNQALTIYKDKRAALFSQIPIATFMVFYTFVGLWLLAAPRGA